MRRRGRARPASARVSATADPRPPMMVWFSAVITWRATVAAARMVAVSRGFITGTLTTDALTWWWRRWVAAARAGATIMPLAKSATSVPSVSIWAWSRDSRWLGGEVTGVWQRLNRR